MSHLAHNKKLYLKILNDFLEDYENLKLEDLDDEEFKRQTHTIKGLSANIGATSLHKISIKLDESQNKDLLTEFYEKLNLVINELKNKLEPLESDVNVLKEDISPNLKDELFDKLRDAIKTKRPKNCEPVLDEINKYKLSKEDTLLFENIKKLIIKYKFKEAQNLFD